MADPADDTVRHRRGTAPLVLASASPRRKDLLAELGLTLEIVPADIDETPRPGVAPWQHVVELAEEKSSVVHEQWPHADVLAADTEVVLDHGDDTAQALGKPADRSDAARMLRRVSGRAVHVVTGMAVRRADGSLSIVTSVSKLAVRHLTDDEIAAYLSTGAADDKAGALAVQGGAAGFVTHIDGCYTNVVGLPLCRAASLLLPGSGWVCHGPAPSCDAYAGAHGLAR